MPVKVPALQDMTDEHIMRHLELRHQKDLKIKFLPLPGETERRLNEPSAWITYHDTLHRLHLNGDYPDHSHKLPETAEQVA